MHIFLGLLIEHTQNVLEQSITSIGRSMKLQTFDYEQILTRNFIYKAEIK